MTTKELQQIIEQRGHIVKYGYDNTVKNICDVYDYKGDHVGRCHVDAAERLRGLNSSIKKWSTYGATYYADYRCQKYVDHENLEHCHRIAQDCDDYATGKVYRCPECGEPFTMPDDVGDRFCCPYCHETCDTDDFEQCSIYDYLDDPLDWTYTINRDKTYHGVSVMVAYGGPNIYIDTDSQKVELYWWGNRADWPLSSDAVEAVDDWAEECWGCI